MSIKQLENGRFEFKIKGFSFQQNPKSPKLFAFVASANDLIKFCGVARKSQDFSTNYQRALDSKRVSQEVTPFFRTPENCTPTAIVISLQQSNVSDLTFEKFESEINQLGTELSSLTLNFIDMAKVSDGQVIIYAKEFLDSRLIKGDENENENEEDEEDEEEEDNSETSEDDSPVEIGHSMLRQLRNKLDDPTNHTAEMMDVLRDMLKPALVIDGQHRLFGAAGVEENIPLLVCSLVEPSWKEQVFQFIVVNDKASGIPKPFITSLAGMSLTSKELDELRDRLTQAGLRLWEVEVMQKLGYDIESPFHGLIDFKESHGVAGLGYQTMKKVGLAWYESKKSSGLFKIMEILYCKPLEKKLNKKTLKSKWQQSGDWYFFMCIFWKAFKTKFGETQIWKLHSNLLNAVVIEMIQADFMLSLNANAELLFDQIDQEDDDDKRRDLIIKKFTACVKNFVDKHKESLYKKEWKAKSLNHSDGRKHLADLFRKVREEESTSNSAIFTGNI